jgi:hypothetical protein
MWGNMGTQPEPSEKELAKRSERWAYWALIVGIAALVVSVVIAYWTVRRSEELTAATGALDKAKPHLYLGSGKIEMPLRVVIAAPFPDKSVTVIQLPLVVRNDGDKTTKGTELLVREPAGIAVNNDVVKSSVEASLPVSAAPERHMMTSGKYTYVSFALPDMHPEQTAQVNEPVIIMDTTAHGEIKAVSKDGVPFSVAFSLGAGLPIKVSIAGEDLHTNDYDLELVGIKAGRKEDIVSTFEDEVHKEKQSDRNSKSFWRNMVERFSRSPRHALLIYPDLEEVHAEGGTSVYIEKGILDEKDVTYTMP